MENNRFLHKSNDSPERSERDLWLDELQRRFSADLDQKSELFYNSNPHVDGCSSESENDVSVCHPNYQNNSIFAPCSGGSKSRKLSSDERIDDLFRIVKMHSQQINLLQNQIKSLLEVIQHDRGDGRLKNVCSCQNNIEVRPDALGVVAMNESHQKEYKSIDSDTTPKCAEVSNFSSVSRSDPNFFSAVMGTLRGMLDSMDSDDGEEVVETSKIHAQVDAVDKSMFNATLEQLKNLGVSFVDRIPPAQKKVTFLESRPVRTESSVDIDSLAQKYLKTKPDRKKVNAALDHISSMQKRTTDLSLATVKYLKRYKLAAVSDKEGGHDMKTTGNQLCPRNNPANDVSSMSIVASGSSPREGKVLDSFAIRNQPKLLPKPDWLQKLSNK